MEITIKMSLPIGEQMRAYRQSAGLSIKNIAEAMGRDNSSNISSYEKGNGAFNRDIQALTPTTIAFARALGAAKIIVEL